MLGVHDPVLTGLGLVVSHSFLHLLSEGSDDHILQLHQPHVNFLLDLDSGGQGHGFAFLGLDVGDVNVVENVDFDHAIEHSLQVALDDLSVVGLGEHVEHFLIREEIKTRECVSLAFHVALQTLRNLLQQLVLSHDILIRNLGLLDETGDGGHLGGLGTHGLEELVHGVEVLGFTLDSLSEFSRSEDVL